MMRLSFSRLLVFSITAAALAPLYGEVKVNPLFADGAVLQRGQSLPVWGTARDGEKVAVAFAGQTASTTAAGGKWSVLLEPLKEGGPLIMTITGDNVVSVKDILIGDVWLCSGQSNMHFRMKAVENATQEIAAMDFPSVRFFTVKQQFALEPSRDATGAWKAVTPATAADCSAVACYFGTALHRAQGVPIGLIVSSVGGTRIETWMEAGTLAATGESSALVEKWKNMSSEEFEKIGAAYSAFQHQRDQAHPEAVRAAKAQGLAEPPAPVAPKIRCHDRPSALHNGMIAPLRPFAIRGAIWYQGESNAGQSLPYRKLLPALIADWRSAWGEDLPFLFVQLAPHRSIDPSFREAQHHIWQNTPNTAMAVTTDVGNADNIHPTRKRPVGERLATAACALSYGEKITSSGPIFESMETQGARAVISFGHIGGGLSAKGETLTGFTIAGADGKFHPGTAAIEGEKVFVTSAKVAEPKAVYYNWAIMPEGNLFNRDGLPAAPFRSDQPAATSR
jgi:sialate O-acetylesterase